MEREKSFARGEGVEPEFPAGARVSGPWLLEFWVRYSDFATADCGVDSCTGQPLACPIPGTVFTWQNSYKAMLSIQLNGDARSVAVRSGNSAIATGPTLAKEAWNFLAIEKFGAGDSDYRIYVNGTVATTTAIHGSDPISSEVRSSANPRIGDLNGAIRGLRIAGFSFLDSDPGAEKIAQDFRKRPVSISGSITGTMKP